MINGNKGDDVIVTGAGDDIVIGGEGNDEIDLGVGGKDKVIYGVGMGGNFMPLVEQMSLKVLNEARMSLSFRSLMKS